MWHSQLSLPFKAWKYIVLRLDLWLGLTMFSFLGGPTHVMSLGHP